jgi:hypothetical protein
VALDRVIELLGCLGHVHRIELTGLTAQLTRMLTYDNLHIYVDAPDALQVRHVDSPASLADPLPSRYGGHFFKVVASAGSPEAL